MFETNRPGESTDVPEVVSLADIVVEAFDKQLDVRFMEAREMLGDDGDVTKFFIDNPREPGVGRLYGLQGETRHAVFVTALGFVPGKPTFRVFVGPAEVREGIVGKSVEAAGA